MHIPFQPMNCRRYANIRKTGCLKAIIYFYRNVARGIFSIRGTPASVGRILVSDKTFNIPIIAIHCSNAQNVGFENPTYAWNLCNNKLRPFCIFSKRRLGQDPTKLLNFTTCWVCNPTYILLNYHIIKRSSENLFRVFRRPLFHSKQQI